MSSASQISLLLMGNCRRLAVKPGNLNGSCVRDPVAGDYFVISAPGAGRGVPLGLVLDFVLQF